MNLGDLKQFLDGCDHAEAVDLSSVDYVPATPRRRLYVGGTGDVKVDTVGGETGVTLKAVPAGELHVHVVKVYKTGTTATQIVALW